MSGTRTACFLIALALSAATAGAQQADPGADGSPPEDALTLQNMLEFGPLEDREELSKQSRARFMARSAARPRTPEETTPALTARLTVPGNYETASDLTVTAEVVPSSRTETVRLMVRPPGAASYSPVSMRLTAPGRFLATLGPEYTDRDYLKMYLEAIPVGGGEPVTHGSPREPFVATAHAPIAGGTPVWLLALIPVAAIGWRIAKRRFGLDTPRIPAAAHAGRHAPPPRPASHDPSRIEMNPYQVLRIQRTATAREIDDAYCLMRKLNFYGTVRDSLAIIDLAHDLLMDPDSRREVDEALRHGESFAAHAAPRQRAATMKEAG